MPNNPDERAELAKEIVSYVRKNSTTNPSDAWSIIADFILERERKLKKRIGELEAEAMNDANKSIGDHLIIKELEQRISEAVKILKIYRLSGMGYSHALNAIDSALSELKGKDA